jgi:hypothetical protein
MNTQEPHDVLRQVLEIVDLFEDENSEICTDILLHDRRTSSARDWPDNAELAVMLGEVGLVHVAIVHAAQMIGDAIRAKFGLPAKDGADEAEG